LQAGASELVSKVQARKAELAEAEKKLADAKAAAPAAPAVDEAAERKKAIEAKSTELSAARQRHADAESAYLAANGKLTTLGERLKSARAAGEQRDRLIAQRDIDQRDLEQKILHYESRKKAAELLAYPAVPTEADVTSDGTDLRPRYALISGGAMAALFVLGIMLSGGGSREDARLAESEEYASLGYETEGAEAQAESDESADRPERARPVEV